jgi:hypothetical protein
VVRTTCTPIAGKGPRRDQVRQVKQAECMVMRAVKAIFLTFAWAIWAVGVVLLNLFVLTLPW